ncbi:hypothetical protein MMC11_005006 [Xylographa trunciseda]|nr:hypothetical protein [Xylographa trunciseda]
MTQTETLEVSSMDDMADGVVEQKVKRKWQSYIWDSLDKSPAERRFLFKLDGALLTFACLGEYETLVLLSSIGASRLTDGPLPGYFVKYLDQANVNNAFVSGMKEDLSLNGNQLNYMTTAWTVGYVIGEIPSNIILTRNTWLDCLAEMNRSDDSEQVIWTILTMLLCRCNTANQLYALRFFVGEWRGSKAKESVDQILFIPGLAESTFYPGMQYIIGSWYRKDELAKRSCIFHTSSAIATMFSGYLMTAVYNLDGRGGMAGWKWLFIMDGVISMPVALAGYYFLPDLPETSRARYFSPEEIAYAQKRMKLEGREQRRPYTKAKFKKILSSWHIYGLSLLYVLFNNGAAGAAPVFAQYLKDSKSPVYTVAQINVYPTSTYAVQIVTTISYAWLSDSVLKGQRWPPIVFGACMNIVCYMSLAIWNISEGWRWACYILAGCGYGLSGLCMAWAHEICADDNEERAIVIASMNEMAYVLQAWLPLIVWQQIDAPQYQKGFIAVSVLSLLLIITAFVLKVLHRQQNSRKLLRASTEDEIAEADIPEVSFDIEIKS